MSPNIFIYNVRTVKLFLCKASFINYNNMVLYPLPLKASYMLIKFVKLFCHLLNWMKII